VLPAWWVAMVGVLAAAAGGALVLAWRGLVSATGIRSAMPGPAGDIGDDVPMLAALGLRRCPWLVGVLPALAVGLAFAVFEAHAEHSMAEGIQRGGFEAVAAVLGFVLLGRAIGVRSRSRSRGSA
jgi:hypothetical protein